MCNDQFLSPHFKLSEFTESATARRNGIDNTPPAEAVENLRRLCEGCLEPLREAIGLPVVITSGYRTKALNEILVHAARRSQHMSGQAVDFHISPSGVSGSKSSGAAYQSVPLDYHLRIHRLRPVDSLPWAHPCELREQAGEAPQVDQGFWQRHVLCAVA